MSVNSLRIVMVGKTGAGKSATGNTILDMKAFHSEARATSITRICSSASKIVDGREVLVVDTPGLYDTKMSNEEVINETLKCIDYASPGPHVFLLIISIGRFTAEEKNTVELIQKVFGEGAQKHMMVLFTRADDLEDDQTLDDYIKDSQELTELVNGCNGRYHKFNNKEKSDRTQVLEFLNKIEVMNKQNKNSYYNYHMFKIADELKTTLKSVQEKDKIISKLKRELEEKQMQINHLQFCSIL